MLWCVYIFLFIIIFFSAVVNMSVCFFFVVIVLFVCPCVVFVSPLAGLHTKVVEFIVIVSHHTAEATWRQRKRSA